MVDDDVGGSDGWMVVLVVMIVDGGVGDTTVSVTRCLQWQLIQTVLMTGCLSPFSTPLPPYNLVSLICVSGLSWSLALFISGIVQPSSQWRRFDLKAKSHSYLCHSIQLLTSSCSVHQSKHSSFTASSGDMSGFVSPACNFNMSGYVSPVCTFNMSGCVSPVCTYNMSGCVSPVCTFNLSVVSHLYAPSTCLAVSHLYAPSTCLAVLPVCTFNMPCCLTCMHLQHACLTCMRSPMVISRKNSRNQSWDKSQQLNSDPNTQKSGINECYNGHSFLSTYLCLKN